MFRGGAALQHQIHRREDARDVVRLVIGRGVGRAPQTLRHHAHRHHDRAGIELHRPHARANRLGMMAGIDIGQRQTVIEKRHLDFQRARRNHRRPWHICPLVRLEPELWGRGKLTLIASAVS
jgi:hypothetical protein